MDQQRMQETAEDTYDWNRTSVTDEKIMEILVRLERLDAGQLHLIAKMSDFERFSGEGARERRILANRLDKLEWAQSEHEKRMQEREKQVRGPARHVIASIVASFVTAVLTYLVFHRG